MVNSQLRIGCIDYLNAQPLVHALPDMLPEAELVRDVPSVLAEHLAVGDLDVALIPVVEFLQHANYERVPGIAIGCDGAVRSVKLCCRCPIESVRTVALDPASRTSAALTRILFSKYYGIFPEFVTWSKNDKLNQLVADAVLVIGDRAINCDETTFPVVVDLGLAWKQWTGLPFVFAVWSCRSSKLARCLGQPLLQAKQSGLRRLDIISKQWSTHLGWSSEQCHTYLADVLCYDFGPRQAQAVEQFCSLLESVPGSAFVRRDSPKIAA